MRLVCEECKKAYDYDIDDFCPRCGAYNPPPKTWDSGGQAIIRKDGLNEANHGESFAHSEVHSEKRQRKRTGLDQPKKSKPAPRPAAAKQGEKKAGSPGGKSLAAVIVWIIIIVQFLRLFFGFL